MSIRRVRLLVTALLGGALLGGILTYRPVQPSAEREKLPAATEEICRAICANQPDQWRAVEHRYFSRPGEAHAATSPLTDALAEARAESAHVNPGDPIGPARETASGQAGDRIMVAVTCPIGTGKQTRAVTVHWLRGPDRRWFPDDISSEASRISSTNLR